MQKALCEVIEAAINPCCEITVLVEQRDIVRWDAKAWHGNKTHQHPIADEKCRRDESEMTDFARCEADETGTEVAEGDSRENAIDAEFCEMEVREGGDEKAKREEDDGAANDVSGEA